MKRLEASEEYFLPSVFVPKSSHKNFPNHSACCPLNKWLFKMGTGGPNSEELGMILVMGVTGSGKSYFVNKLADCNLVKVGDDLQSCQY